MTLAAQLVVALYLVAVILACVGLARSRLVDLNVWGVLAVAVAGLVVAL